MLVSRNIEVGQKTILALSVKLGQKSLVLLKGELGYVSCGYLNLEVANKFKDIAVIVSGIETIEDVLKSRVQALSDEAKKIGLKEGQLI